METTIDNIYPFAKDIIIDNIVREIIQTPEFVRLKGIKQAGITGLFT
jgi:HD superfamily phosphohydrolase